MRVFISSYMRFRRQTFSQLVAIFGLALSFVLATPAQAQNLCSHIFRNDVSIYNLPARGLDLRYDAHTYLESREAKIQKVVDPLISQLPTIKERILAQKKVNYFLSLKPIFNVWSIHENLSFEKELKDTPKIFFKTQEDLQKNALLVIEQYIQWREKEVAKQIKKYSGIDKQIAEAILLHSHIPKSDLDFYFTLRRMGTEVTINPETYRPALSLNVYSRTKTPTLEIAKIENIFKFLNFYDYLLRENFERHYQNDKKQWQDFRDALSDHPNKDAIIEAFENQASHEPNFSIFYFNEMLQQGLKIIIDPKMAQPNFQQNLGSGIGPVIRLKNLTDLNVFLFMFDRQIKDWPDQNKKMLAQWQLIESEIYKNKKDDYLIDAHERFKESGGVVKIEPSTGVDDSAHFMYPSKSREAPVIRLTSLKDITSGTYKHELQHFRDWVTLKEKMISKGFTEEEAHTALFKYADANKDRRRQAIVSQWLESRAVGKYSTYPEAEAIRRLTLENSFLQEIYIKNTPTRNEVLRYMKLSIDKLASKYSQTVLDTFFSTDPSYLFTAKGKERANSITKIKTDLHTLINDLIKEQLASDLTMKVYLDYALFIRVHNTEIRKAITRLSDDTEIQKYIQYVIRIQETRLLQEIREELKGYQLTEAEIRDIAPLR